MALNLNLDKAAEGLKLSLQKAGVDVSRLVMEIAFLLDVSGSFEDEHRDGSTNDLLERFVPWGLLFDPDGKLDLITFSNGPGRVHHVGEVTKENFRDFIRREVIGKVPGWNGGTDYSYALEQAMRLFGWLPNGAPVASQKSGLLGGLFGKKSAAVPAAQTTAKRKSLVIFITDGDNSDKDRTRQVLRASQQRGDDIYFLFIGYSNQGGQFPFLDEIADEFDNTGLVIVQNIAKFVNQPDEVLNQQLLGEELITWLGRK